jgi:hypothetical protein
MGMTRAEVDEMTKNDCVIMRNDGRIIQDELGNIKTFTPHYNYASGRGEIEKIMAICKRIKANYTYTLVKYHQLPQHLKY